MKTAVCNLASISLKKFVKNKDCSGLIISKLLKIIVNQSGVFAN